MFSTQWIFIQEKKPVTITTKSKQFPSKRIWNQQILSKAYTWLWHWKLISLSWDVSGSTVVNEELESLTISLSSKGIVSWANIDRWTKYLLVCGMIFHKQKFLQFCHWAANGVVIIIPNAGTEEKDWK